MTRHLPTVTDLLALSTDSTATQVLAAVCPVAPGNAQQYIDEIMGYVLWGVLIMFSVGVIIGIGAIVAGRIFSMPHASKAGVVSIVVMFAAGIGYLVLPGMVDGFMGDGCVAATLPGLVTVPVA
ncbi:hypothetical protein [Aquipuribacter hungaricus]|uniref:TrbC/VIRB2 family protein n=1 Tax=Aquipuribacter hungaricus TaxID=545624 RepID=A0ABV7WIC8_9MICO